MKIINLTEGSSIYTPNVYLVTGTWNALDDVNTLVDVGMDQAIVKRINESSGRLLLCRKRKYFLAFLLWLS